MKPQVVRIRLEILMILLKIINGAADVASAFAFFLHTEHLKPDGFVDALKMLLKCLPESLVACSHT